MWKRLVWGALLAILAIAVVRLFWFDIYHVDTGSMEPTILGRHGSGEWVQVVYDDSEPRRFDLLVVMRDGARTPLVKRVVGLPGETIQILRGDILINGERLAADEPKPPLAVLFDSAHQPIDEFFHMGTGKRAWSRGAAGPGESGDEWLLDGNMVALGTELGLMFFQPRLHDGFLGPDGEVYGGAYDVGDGSVEFSVRVDEDAGVVRVGLTEMGDLFEARYVAEDKTLTLTRRNRPDVLEELTQISHTMPIGRYQRWRFENRDNHLRLWIDDELLLEYTYDVNLFHPLDTARVGQNPAQRVKFGGEACEAAFKDIRVLRDLHWRARGEHGIHAPEPLGPDEYFLLGDSSANSRDSRDWGPVRRHEILGRARRVVWPLKRWRQLVPRGAPAVSPGPAE